MRRAAHVDSRGLGLSFPGKLAAGLKLTTEPVIIRWDCTGSREFEIKAAQLNGEVRLVSYTFPKAFVDNPIFPAGNFGVTSRKHFAVTLDQKAKLMKFAAKRIVAGPPEKSAAAKPQPGRA